MEKIYENTLPKGTVLYERYHIEKPLGAGGFGITYLGRDLKLDMPVAIKEYYDNSAKSRKKQLQEAQTMARFSGESHIVNVRDFFEEHQRTYIVMEYLDGITLKRYLEENGKLSFEAVWKLLYPIMEVLKKIHASGALHRDISPDNIMIVGGNRVKLLDFGAAGEFDNEEQKTVTVVLKPGYAPAEQYQGSSYQGPWTDVYALCGVIYKCITGLTPEDSLKRMFHDELKRPSLAGAVISDAQEEVLMQGLELKFDRRIQSIQQLMSEFENAENMIPVATRVLYNRNLQEETGIEEFDRGNTKQKTALRLLAGIAAAAAAIVFAFWFTDNPYRRENSHISMISDKKVTKSDIRRLNDRTTTDVKFFDCEISDDVIEKLRSLKNVDVIEFNDCTGFTTLSALSEMEALGAIYYDSESINGAELFEGDFGSVRSLILTSDEIVGGLNFLDRFTGLEGLYFIGDPKGIDHLEFLKNMPNLKSFYLTGGENVDLSGNKTAPLAYCTMMDDLEIDDTNVSDLSFAKNMPALRWLKAANCNITDLSAIAGCTEMYYMDLNGNQISDVSALKGMTQITTLHLSDNQISDISALAEMTELSDLMLENNRISDITSLANKERLAALNLAGNQVSDLMPLHQSKGMINLFIENNQIITLDGCEQMIELNNLSAADNLITDISMLNCATVTRVDLENNQVADLSVFDGRCSELYLLNINNNQVSSLAPLSSAGKLRALLADNNNLTSLSGMENKTELYGISAYNNQITDIAGLSADKLAYLDLGCNQISDISSLAGMNSGELYLMLEKNRITDISCLPPDISYNILSLYGNPISDFSVAAQIKNINFMNDSFFFSHYEGMDYQVIGQIEYQAKAYAVDVPLEQQSQIKATMQAEKEHQFIRVASFISTEQADALMKETREHHRDLLRKLK